MMSYSANQLFQTLQFSSKLTTGLDASATVDRNFRHYYLHSTLPVARITMGLSILLIAAICVLDVYMMPAAFLEQAIPLRIFAMILPWSIVLGLSLIYKDSLWLPYVITVAALISGITIVIVGGIAIRTGAQFVLWAMLFTTFITYLVLGLTMRQSMMAAWPVLGFYVAAGIYLEAPLIKMAYGTMFLTFSNLVGSYAAYLLEYNARQMFDSKRALAKLARTDGLTGLNNRRHFDEHMRTVWRQSKRHQKNLAIVIVDIDYFKIYNDCYGHQLGDVCIKRVADVLASSVNRPLDLVARYGGEEYAIILYDPAPAYLESFTQKLCQKVFAENVEHMESSVASRVTVSIGAAISDEKGPESPDDLLRQADDSLYEAKSQGRNQAVVSHSDWLAQTDPHIEAVHM